MLVFSNGLTTSTEVMDAFIADITGLPYPLGWSQIYENPALTSFDFTTDAGPENTTNRFAVLRAKLSHNTGGAGDNEFTYVILEDDTSNNRILVRSCTSFSFGGASSGVMDLANSISNGALTNITASNSTFTNGTEHNISLSLQDAGGFQHVWINQIEHVVTTPDATSNHFIAVGKVGTGTAWIPTSTYHTAKQSNVVRLAPAGMLTNKADILLVATALGDSSSYFGKIKHLFESNNTTAQDFDRLHEPGDATYYFALKSGTGTTAVLS